MLRDSKGRFTRNNTKKKSILLALPKKKQVKEEFNEWENLNVSEDCIFNDLIEPIIIHVSFNSKNRFDRRDCINNASIFDKLNWDERAKFISTIFHNGHILDEELDSVESHKFEDWFFDYFSPEVFHKILGD